MNWNMFPAGANIICVHGSDVLLIQRSGKTNMWPWYWAFPGGKVDDGELFREAWLRELTEELWIIAQESDIFKETIVLTRNVTRAKIVYFGVIDEWENIPEIQEPHLAEKMAWFPLDSLPDHIIPHHALALEALEKGIAYSEYDIAPQ